MRASKRKIEEEGLAAMFRWREFFLDDDPKERLVRRDDRIVGEEEFRWRVHRQEARPAPRAARAGKRRCAKDKMN